MSEQQPNDKSEPAPNNEPTPSASTKPSLRRTIVLPPAGRAYVISGLPPATAKASKQEPELHLRDANQMTFQNMMDLFRKLNGREPTPEEIEEARTEWDKQDSEGR